MGINNRCKHGMLDRQCSMCYPPVKVKSIRVKPIKIKKVSPKLKFRIEKQFEKYLRDVASDAVADGFELDQIAYDLADSLRYDPDVISYIKRRHSWIEKKQQLIEFLADNLVG